MGYSDFLFTFGLLFAMLDAYNIGANDVANSWATSVSSRSLTMRQATCGAALFEFLGAVLAGQRVSGTIKNGIISNSAFQNNAGVQLLGFTVAISASATWLTIATYNGWPVSTTYSIVSALIGVGVATGGVDSVRWGWNNARGVAAIWAGMGIAPAMAAGFAATVYLITKFFVLLRKNPIRYGLILSPFFFFTVTAVLTMSIVYKGAPELNLDELSNATIAAAIVGTAAVVAALSAIFWLPFVYCRVVRHDYTVRWYHFFQGPLLWKRQPPADAGQIGAPSSVPDYRIVKDDHVTDVPFQKPVDGEKVDPEAIATTPTDKSIEEPRLSALEKEPQIEGPWILPRNLYIIFRYRVPRVLLHGSSVDIHKLQAANGSGSADRMQKMYAHARQFDNKTEHLFSFLQVMTACTASFAHGSNDLANASGPFAVIYHTWSTGTFSGSQTESPIWIFVFLAICLVIGLATYGYNIMAVLGNRLTLISPSRGYAMELGASITVILASQYAIPVSTTMCITGGTLGVALCNGDIRAFNWRGLAWIVLGWILTVPVVATLSGCLMGILLNAPSFGVNNPFA